MDFSLKMDPMLFQTCINFVPIFLFPSSHFSLLAYSTFYIVGLILSMQIPFVGFQPIRTSEHMAAAGKKMKLLHPTACLMQENVKHLQPCFFVLEKTQANQATC